MLSICKVQNGQNTKLLHIESCFENEPKLVFGQGCSPHLWYGLTAWFLVFQQFSTQQSVVLDSTAIFSYKLSAEYVVLGNASVNYSIGDVTNKMWLDS